MRSSCRRILQLLKSTPSPDPVANLTPTDHVFSIPELLSSIMGCSDNLQDVIHLSAMNSQTRSMTSFVIPSKFKKQIDCTLKHKTKLYRRNPNDIISDMYQGVRNDINGVMQEYASIPKYFSIPAVTLTMLICIIPMMIIIGFLLALDLFLRRKEYCKYTSDRDLINTSSLHRWISEYGSQEQIAELKRLNMYLINDEISRRKLNRAPLPITEIDTAKPARRVFMKK